MRNNDISNVFLALASIVIGVFLGSLSNKLMVLNDKSWLRTIFYLFCGGVILFSIFCVCFYFSILTGLTLWLIFFTAVFSILLIWFTCKYLVTNKIFKTRDLDPIVNEFTKNSDKNEIRLLCGDLDFFGETPTEMERNEQYKVLRSEKFKVVSILCKEPRNGADKIRYGKLLHDLQTVKVKFYNPSEPDLQLRGRLKELQGVTRLLIYQKVSSGKYKAVEIDTAQPHGALYNNLWHLLWETGKSLDENEARNYINILIGR